MSLYPFGGFVHKRYDYSIRPGWFVMQFHLSAGLHYSRGELAVLENQVLEGGSNKSAGG